MGAKHKCPRLAAACTATYVVGSFSVSALKSASEGCGIGSRIPFFRSLSSIIVVSMVRHRGKSRYVSARAFPLEPPSRAVSPSTTVRLIPGRAWLAAFPVYHTSRQNRSAATARLRLDHFGPAADTAVPVQPQNVERPFWGMNFAGSVWDRHGGGCPQAKRSYTQWRRTGLSVFIRGRR